MKTEVCAAPLPDALHWNYQQRWYKCGLGYYEWDRNTDEEVFVNCNRDCDYEPTVCKDFRKPKCAQPKWSSVWTDEDLFKTLNWWDMMSVDYDSDK